jgi:regulator of sigma E protease
MVTGRMPNEKFQYAMQAIGMVIILTLMVLIFGLDIYNAIVGN